MYVPNWCLLDAREDGSNSPEVECLNFVFARSNLGIEETSVKFAFQQREPGVPLRINL